MCQFFQNSEIFLEKYGVEKFFDSLVSYVECWRSLENVLMERSDRATDVCFFGSGEMTGLLRAYAPGLWRRCSALYVDDIYGGRLFDRAVMGVKNYDRHSQKPMILSLKPSSQGQVYERLIKNNVNCVRFDDFLNR